MMSYLSWKCSGEVGQTRFGTDAERTLDGYNVTIDHKKTTDLIFHRENKMKINVKIAIDYFSRKPGKLFLLDGLGAALTAFSLFFVLRPYCSYVGMPANVLTYLSVIGLVYCAYSMSCYFLLKDYRAPYLRIIGMGNSLYSLLTMALSFTYYNSLTRIGWTYFLAEILTIMLLAYLELSVANLSATRQTD